MKGTVYIIQPKKFSSKKPWKIKYNFSTHPQSCSSGTSVNLKSVSLHWYRHVWLPSVLLLVCLKFWLSLVISQVSCISPGPDPTSWVFRITLFLSSLQRKLQLMQFWKIIYINKLKAILWDCIRSSLIVQTEYKNCIQLAHVTAQKITRKVCPVRTNFPVHVSPALVHPQFPGGPA